MKIEPDLFQHPKYLRLRKHLKHEPVGYLLRMWMHCQHCQRGEEWAGVDVDYVESVCCWEGEPGELFAALLQFKWIEQSQEAVIIHDWDFHNKGLWQRWKNNPRGGAGRNPIDPPIDPPTSNGTGSIDHRPSTGDRTGHQDRLIDGLIEKKEERRSPPPPEEPVIPTAEEIVTFGSMAAGIPPDYCRHYHERRTTLKGWLGRHHELIDWRHDIVSGSWWGRDRATWKTLAVPASPELEKIRAELEWQKTPARIAELRRRKRELEGPVHG